MKLKKITVQYYDILGKSLKKGKHVYKETENISALGHLYDDDGTLANALEDSGALDIYAEEVILDRFVDSGGYIHRIVIKSKPEEE